MIQASLQGDFVGSYTFLCSLLLVEQKIKCRDSDLQNACTHFLLREA